MIFRDNHERSILPKAFIALAIGASILVCGHLMFAAESALLAPLKAYKVEGNLGRSCLILVGMIIYYLRLLVTLFVFFQRKMYWLEALMIANIMPWLFPYIAYASGRYNGPIGWIEALGILLFLAGSYLNSASEYTRFRWKQKNENAGRIYTSGLFTYSRHINYFGDILIFSGVAAMARQVELLFIPAFMAAIFILILIPLKENYLKQKYGDAFSLYAAKTKKIIPWIY